MIYLRGENTFDAKPGDFMVERSMGFLELRIMVKQDVCGKEQAGWCFVCRFHEEKYKNEIIDGKPTPELIARFSQDGARESGKRFEAPNCTLVYRDGTIFEVSPVQIEHPDRQYMFYVSSTQSAPNEYFIDFRFKEKNEAESERERLIAWLEG